MNKVKWIVWITVIVLIISVSVVFYRTIFIGKQPENYTGFTNDLVMPAGITITDKVDKPLVTGTNLREGEVAIYDKVVVKTIIMEVGKSPLTKVEKADKQDISDTQRAFSIGTIYGQEAPESNRLTTIEVLQDGTFITSKVVNGKEIYVKGKFGKYTMDYLVGLYTLK